MAEGFRINEYLAEIGALTGDDLNQEDFLRQVLQKMILMGFERARFWEVGDDISTQGRTVILVDRLPEDDPSVEPGYLAKWSESDIAKADKGLNPVVIKTPGKSALSPLEKELDLAGRVRVEIPVTAGTETESILACDWRGPKSRLSDSDLRALRLVGSQIGSHLALESLGSGHRSTSTRTKKPDLAPAELVYKVARDLGEEIDAAVTAVFAFSWPHQRLIKRRQFVSPQFDAAAKRQGKLEESYSAGGPALTGLAWQDPDFRQVISLEGLRKRYDIAIDRDSLDWHNAVLGEIRTVLYAVVGTLEERYLIRMMNRASRPELPFLREGHVLHAAIQDLRADVDAAISMQRLRSLQEISGLSAESQDLDGIVETIGTALSAERIDNFVALCHQRASPQFSFVRGLGRFENVRFNLNRRWEDDSLYKVAISDKLNVAVVAEHTGTSELAEQLSDKGFKAVLSQPMQAGQTEGVFLIGLEALPPRTRGKSRELPDKLGYGTIGLIHAYSRMLANAVEMMHSHERVIGARRAYGLMGHEVRRPAAALGSAGRNAILASAEALEQMPDTPLRKETVGELEKARKDLNLAQRRLGSALRLAKLVARESEGTLRLKFDKADLTNVLRRAVDDVTLQVNEEKIGWAPYFTFNEASKSLGQVVCSEDYVEEALRNVLLNAVKYSLPRHPQARAGRQTVRIAIYGVPQEGWIGIQIRNWGWAIPSRLRDVIFDPWVRGYQEEGTEALAGMGLGLFLARRLIVAHDGEILCFSQPTDDNFYPKPAKRSTAGQGVPRERPDPVSIHETTFEVRIPRNLEPGDRTHRWGPAGMGTKDVPIGNN